MSLTTQKKIISTWFKPCLEAGLSIFEPALWPKEVVVKSNALWFGGGAELDEQLRKDFGPALASVKDGKLKSWEKEPESMLSLLILCDQFSRNIHRGSPDAFEQDHYTQDLAQRAIEQGIPNTFPCFFVRHFFYLPLMHAEDLDKQTQCVSIYESEVKKAVEMKAPEDYIEAITNTLKFAQDHRSAIERFGRFPSRNAVLGRANTEEEAEYLKTANTWGQ